MSELHTTMPRENPVHEHRRYRGNTDSAAASYTPARHRAAENRASAEDAHWANVTAALFPAMGKRVSVGVCPLIEGDLSPSLICTLCIQASTHLHAPVLLIEADWSRPSFADSLGAPAAPGLGELLASPTHQMFHSIHRTQYKHVWLMPAGGAPQILNTRELESRCREIYKALPPGIENVVVALPAVRKRGTLPVACSMADRFAFIITPHSVAAREIRAAARRLGLTDSKVAGVIWADHAAADASVPQ